MKLNFITTAHAARTASLDPLQKYKFRVLIPGLATEIGFTTVSGLSEEIEVTEYQEGGFDYPHKLPGRVTVPEVTLERGEYADSSMADLVKTTLTNPNFRQTVTIQKLDRFGAVAREYRLAEAWCSKWEGSDSDASSSDAAIETITLQFEYYL